MLKEKERAILSEIIKKEDKIVTINLLLKIINYSIGVICVILIYLLTTLFSITISPALIGGLLLILGAFFTYKGDINKAVFVYFFADLAWVTISFLSGDYVGMIFVIIGMVLGLGAYIKMNLGIMNKTL